MQNSNEHPAVTGGSLRSHLQLSEPSFPDYTSLSPNPKALIRQTDESSTSVIVIYTICMYGYNIKHYILYGAS